MISLSKLLGIHTPNKPIKLWKELSKVNLKGKLIKSKIKISELSKYFKNQAQNLKAIRKNMFWK